tara:strand:+ start:16428 stop:17210 length:783 start_codon:yes stop_codon:yes gene_type:complete
MADTNVIETHEDAPPESQEHIQEMIDKAERVQSVPRDDGKPTWLPDKFENPEDLAEAYAQLEQKLSGKEQTETEVEQSPSPQLADTDNVEQALKQQGLDFRKYAQEYSEKGVLSEESYAELSEGGMTKDVVDTWIAGQQSIADQIKTKAFDSVGGEEEYNSLIEWAKDSLSENEIDAFNRAIENPNTDDVIFAITSLNARRNLAVGETPTLLQGDTGTKKEGNSFKSVVQLTKAMQDPRYQKDPAYRDEVTEKLAQSSIM